VASPKARATARVRKAVARNPRSLSTSRSITASPPLHFSNNDPWKHGAQHEASADEFL
jgi:hypothetical protein